MKTEHMKARCEALVIALWGAAEAKLWWLTPNVEFEYCTPIQVWEQNPQAIHDYLMFYNTNPVYN